MQNSHWLFLGDLSTHPVDTREIINAVLVYGHRKNLFISSTMFLMLVPNLVIWNKRSKRVTGFRLTKNLFPSWVGQATFYPGILPHQASSFRHWEEIFHRNLSLEVIMAGFKIATTNMTEIFNRSLLSGSCHSFLWNYSTAQK